MSRFTEHLAKSMNRAGGFGYSETQVINELKALFEDFAENYKDLREKESLQVPPQAEPEKVVSEEPVKPAEQPPAEQPPAAPQS